MKVEKINTFNDKVEAGVNNEYPTSKYLFTQPCIGRVSDGITVRFGLIEGHGCTTGKDHGE